MTPNDSLFKDLKDFIASPWIRAFGKYKNAVIVNNVSVHTVRRGTQSIDKWRNALQAAESPTQDRRMLYDLYADILLDGHLKSAVKGRINEVCNQDYIFTLDGEQIDEVQELIEKSYFGTLLKMIMHSRMYGHSLVELGWPARGSDAKGWTAEVDRRYVKPRYGLVVPEASSMSGYEYREPPYDKTVFEFGEHEDLGDILEACQYVIYKRGNFGDWNEFAEVFGMPFRWAKYNSAETKEMLESALEDAGSAGFVVAPEDASIETVHSTTQGGGDVFRFLNEALNKEISVTINGQSMTQNDSRNSGFAQAKVHEKVMTSVNEADRRYVLQFLNELIVDYLDMLGYRAKGGKFSIKDEEHLSMTERVMVDQVVSKHVPIPESHWYETYKISRPTFEDPPARPQVQDEDGGERAPADEPTQDPPPGK